MKNNNKAHRKIIVLICAMVVGILFNSVIFASDEQDSEEKYRILFIGNSHTYYNNMPEMFKGLAIADGKDCEVTSITSKGYKLSEFADENDVYGKQVYDALTTSSWDYVVVQENREVLVEKPDKTEKAVDKLHSLIKNTGAKMVMYATQPNNIGSTFKVNSASLYLTDLQIEQILTRNNFKIANEYDCPVAASGTNFMRVMHDYPEIPMYISDNLHPTVEGSYMAACTIYHTVFNQSPYGNAFLPQSEYDTDNLLSAMSVENALILQQIADGRLTINQHYVEINKGQSSKLLAMFEVSEDNHTLSEYKNSILWDSTDLTGVSINRLTGEFTALKTGKYQVMATMDNGLIGYSTIDVKQPSTSFEINENKILKVVRGYEGQYTSKLKPADTTDSVTWTSNSPDIVSVDEQGNIKAKKVGIAKITAVTTSGLKVNRYVRVKLKAPSKVTLTKKVKKLKKKKKFSVNIKWKKNTKAVKYYVYRKVAGATSYKKIATTTKAKYTDKKVKKNKTYYYKIKAINSNSKLNSARTPAYSIQIK